MSGRTIVVPHDELPDAVFELLRAGFPDDTIDQRAFWEPYPDSIHALVYDEASLVAHAGVIARTMYVAGRAIDAAYIEYVAAEPRGRGFGTAAMRAIEVEVRQRGFLLAALATGSPGFYQRLGWQRWRGPAAYRKDGAVVPAPDEIVMVLDLGAGVDLEQQIECEWRAGDIW